LSKSNNRLRSMNGQEIHFKTKMKALGVTISCDLDWSDHIIKNVIPKGKSQMVGFRFLKIYLSEEQFLTTVANSFYSTLFYGSTVWYHSSKANDLKQIDLLYYRLLQTTCRDFKKEISRVKLEKRCKRASPREWVNY